MNPIRPFTPSLQMPPGIHTPMQYTNHPNHRNNHPIVNGMLPNEQNPIALTNPVTLSTHQGLRANCWNAAPKASK